MFRVFLLPLIVFVIFAMLISMIVYTYRKIRRGVQSLWNKSANLANDHRNKRDTQEKRSRLPETLQKAYRQYDKLEHDLTKLPETWKRRITPLVKQAHEILDAVSLTPDRTETVRGFFHHTLDSLSQLVERLANEQEALDAEQQRKVEDNLAAFETDLKRHQKTLKRFRRMDFDVLMEVIKARLKS